MSGIFYDGHLTIESARKIKAYRVTESELFEAVSHIAECEKCAELYAACFKEEELAEIPAGVAVSAAEKIEREVRKKRRSFAVYVAEVAVSACAALAITFSGVFNLIPGCFRSIVKIEKPAVSFTENLKSNIRNFSQNSIKKEVIFFEKKEK